MKPVKRYEYNPEDPSGPLVKDKDGEWIYYDDYEELLILYEKALQTIEHQDFLLDSTD